MEIEKHFIFFEEIAERVREKHRLYGDLWLDKYLENLQGTFLINGEAVPNLITKKGKQLWIKAILSKKSFALTRLWITSDDTTPSEDDLTADFCDRTQSFSHRRSFEMPFSINESIYLTAFLAENEANFPIEKIGVLAESQGEKILFAEQLKSIANKDGANLKINYIIAM